MAAYIYNAQTEKLDDSEYASSHFYLITNISVNSIALLALIPAIIKSHKIPYHEEVMLQLLYIST